MPLTWKDETAYEPRIPRTWVADTAVRIVVTRHRHYPDDTWVLRCELPGLDTYDLKTNNLEEAKAKALALVENKLRVLLDSLHA